MRSIESSAKTMEEAVTLGLEKLGLSIGDVDVEILEEGQKGFLGLIGNKHAKVRLTVKDTEEENLLGAFTNKQAHQKSQKQAAEKPKTKKQEPKAEAKKEPAKAESKPTPKTESKPAPKADGVTAPEAAPLCNPETPEGKAQQFLLKLTAMMGVNVSVAAKRDEEGNVRVDMHGDTLGILIGRRGETLDALQYLTSLTVNRGEEKYTRVTLDTENYRAKREEALVRLANRMANRAVKTGRKVVMEPMNPYERRILHSALQSNDAVDTHSEGEEPNRHVVITLKQNS